MHPEERHKLFMRMAQQLERVTGVKRSAPGKMVTDVDKLKEGHRFIRPLFGFEWKSELV